MLNTFKHFLSFLCVVQGDPILKHYISKRIRRRDGEIERERKREKQADRQRDRAREKEGETDRQTKR